MKNLLKLLPIFSLLLAGSSCQQRNSKEDESLAARYIKNVKSLWSKSEQSPLYRDQNEFLGPEEEEFIPLQEEDLHIAYIDQAIPQSRETPGELGSRIPGIERFIEPTSAEYSVFKTLYFNTNDHTLRSKEYIQIAYQISTYLKQHSEVYLFISGHCDERGSEAYNLALGTRRANHVRTLLVQNGVDPERIFTISYGKDKPAAFGHSPLDWSKNRRADFKIHNQSKKL